MTGPEAPDTVVGMEGSEAEEAVWERLQREEGFRG